MGAGVRSALLVGSLTALLILDACLCADDVVTRVASPDGRLVATYYVRNCGATTDYVSTVNLRSTKAKFRADEGVVFTAKGEHRIGIEWTAARHLRLRCDSCKRDLIYRQVVRFGDVDIDFDLPQ